VCQKKGEAVPPQGVGKQSSNITPELKSEALNEKRNYITKRIDEITPMVNDGFDKKTGTFKNEQSYSSFKERQSLLKELEDIDTKMSVVKENANLIKQKNADAKLKELDRSIDSFSEPQKATLLSEAKKHDTLDRFLSKMRGSSTQYGEYSPKLRNYVKPQSVFVGDIKGLDPESTITVYRGIDSKSVSGKGIKNGDFVTTDYNDALAYTDSPSKVVSIKTKLKNLVTEYPDEVDISNPKNPVSYELLYKPDRKMNKVTDTQLTDIWNEAHGKTGQKSFTTPAMSAGVAGLGVGMTMAQRAIAKQREIERRKRYATR
jgi:hypothetical protein